MAQLPAENSTLARAVRRAAEQGRLSHAIVLSGDGDLLDAARFIAASHVCEEESKPCLRCRHCRKVLEGIHPDVTVVRDTEHRELTVDAVRALRQDVYIRPNEAARKVYIIADSHQLNERDQNVLLKIVEEGPPYAAFLFCAENASVLLPTIRSRCVEVKLPPAGTVGEDDERTRELLRLIAEGRAAARAAFLLKLETAKATREELAALFEGARVILADALCTLCGAPPAEPRDEQALRAVLGSRLTKAQILGTIELLETYRNHCEYNVGVGPLLGGLAVELEEIL